MDYRVKEMTLFGNHTEKEAFQEAYKIILQNICIPVNNSIFCAID
jgi:hypothetical protein